MRAICAASALALGLPLAAQSPFGAPAVVGRILWPEHDLSKAQVRFYRDLALTDLCDAYPTGDEGGGYLALLEPGEFYLMAVVDVNGDEKLDEGDGVGYYGVSVFDPQTQKPKALKVQPDAFIRDVQIPITATIGPDKRPVALSGEPAKVEVQPSGLATWASGTVTAREDLGTAVFVELLQAGDHSPVAVARLTPTDPGFSFPAQAGEYVLLAVADVSGDGRFGTGDRVGVYGVTNWSKVPEAMPTLSLREGDDIGGLEVALTGRLGEEGLVSPAEGQGTYRLDPASLPAVVCGTVRQPGEGGKPAQVRVSAEPGMGDVVASVPADAEGRFAAALAPGTYFLTALTDRDADGRFGPGDLVGFQGIADLQSGAPKPLTLGAATVLEGLEITMAGRVTDEGKLAPITAEPNAEGTPKQ
jgi:uncharacterized protein (DUF2141 family)